MNHLRTLPFSSAVPIFQEVNVHSQTHLPHDLSGGDACERSNRRALPRRSSAFGAVSWRLFWFDHNFCSMIFGRVMAIIPHGGGSCMGS